MAALPVLSADDLSGSSLLDALKVGGAFTLRLDLEAVRAFETTGQAVTAFFSEELTEADRQKISPSYEQLESKQLLQHRIGQPKHEVLQLDSGSRVSQIVTAAKLKGAFDLVDQIARSVLEGLAGCLGIRRKSFAPVLDDLPSDHISSSLLQCFKYTPVIQDLSEAPTAVEAHTDRGLLTFVYPLVRGDIDDGLEIQDIDGVWSNVECSTGRLDITVFAGAALEAATGGIIHAPSHRVVAKSRIRQSLDFSAFRDSS